MDIQVLYELYDIFPAYKGSSRRTYELLKLTKTNPRINFTLICKFKTGDFNHKYPFDIKRIEPNYDTPIFDPIKEGLTYRKKFSEISLDNYNILHSRSPWAGVPIIHKRGSDSYKYIYECNGLPSLELPYIHPNIFKKQRKNLRKLAQNEIHCAFKADQIIVVSKVAKTLLISKGILEEKISIIPNGFDPNQFYPSPTSEDVKNNFFSAPEHKYSSDDIILGYIGAFQPWQGLITLVEGLHKIVEEIPNLKLVLVGKSKFAWRKYLRKIVKQTNVRDHLIIIKETEYTNKIPELINSFDFAISPLENTPRNTLMGPNPIKLYEYAACDIPIIVTDLPITREIFSETDVYFTKYPSDSEYISELIQIITHNLNSPKMPRNAVKNETWNSRRRELKKLYQNLID